MEAEQGIEFLKALIREGKVTVGEIEKAIEIAGSKSPSSSISDARSYYIQSHIGASVIETEAFAKGTRWLAVLRRDRGQSAFLGACQELRQLVQSGTWVSKPVKPLAVAWSHLARHFLGSGVVGATIDRWQDAEALLADPVVKQFLDQVLTRLNPDVWDVQMFDLVYPGEVGYAGTVRVSDIPVGYKIWQETREGYQVNVTDAPATRTKLLRFVFAQKPDAWLLISVWATADVPVRPLSDTDWWKDWAFFDIR